MSKVYTKTGDEGITGLIGGARLPKTHIVFDVLGTIDELNCQIGLLITYVEQGHVKEFLKEIQTKIYFAMSFIAATVEASLDFGTETGINNLNRINKEDIAKLETEIDRYSEQLEPLTDFIKPGGNRTSAICHVARAVCRRAERHLLILNEQFALPCEVTQFFNRFSDYLFIFARVLVELDDQK